MNETGRTCCSNSPVDDTWIGGPQAAGSYLSSGDKRVHFGLGAAKQLKLLEVNWPSGQVQKLENVRANQILRVEEPSAE